MKDQIHLLKKRLRLAMNGVASASMREKGLNYQLNFGVSIPQLKQIAKDFPKRIELAEYCRNSNSREMKILATMLQPIKEFTPEMADKCVTELPTVEIAQQYCINLFQFLPYAKEKTFEWLANEKELIRITGYLLLLRIFVQDEKISEESELLFLNYVKKDISSSSFQLKKSAIDCLKRYGRRNKEYAQQALKCISDFTNSSNPEEKECYEDVKFDIEFHLER